MSFKRCLLVLTCLLMFTATAHAAEPALTILKPQGTTRDGLPVMQTHPEADAIGSELNRGLPARMVKLFAWEQTYLQRHGGPVPEPAYLVLTPNSGGFPKEGFYLDGQAKPAAGYAEVRDGAIVGAWGAVDQIFPHELGHVILRQLSGVPISQKSPQMHEVGTRTDPLLALSEGFAEHLQIMAVDDPDAAPATRALGTNTRQAEWLDAHFADYARGLSSRWGVAPFTRAAFRGWFGQAQSIARYFPVKANAFARQPAIPDRLLDRRNLFGAWLLENTLPGRPADPPKTAAQMLSTEGVVSAFFYRLVTDHDLQSHYRDAAFYAQFGAAPSDVAPLENVYLKLFHVFYIKHTASMAEVIRGYKELFPDEEALIDRVTSDVLLGQAIPDAPEFWLANTGFQVGLGVMDQFRRLSHHHAFDLNAASLVDLLSIPGVDRPLAEAMRTHGPYTTLEDLKRVPGMTAAVERSIAQMADRAQYNSSEVMVESFGAYALRMLCLLTVLGALAYWAVLRTRWWRAALNALLIALFSLLPAWFLSGWLDLFVPLLAVFLCGLPATLWRLRKGWRPAARTLLAWLAAAAPALAIPFLRF